MPFTPVFDGDLAIAPSVQQIIDAMQGVTGAGQAISFTSFESSTAPALALQNLDETYGWAMRIYGSDGSTLVDVRDATTTFDGGTLTIDNVAHTVSLEVSTIETYLKQTDGAAFDLEAFAGGVTINDVDASTESGNASILAASNTAWTAAFAAVTAAYADTGMGAKIRLGRGNYLAPQSGLTWPNYMTIEGAGMDSTSILHRTLQTATAPILFYGTHHNTLANLTIKGNYDQVKLYDDNSASAFGGGNAEISMEPRVTSSSTVYSQTGGYDNTLYKVRVQDFWNEAIRCGGKRNKVIGCEVIGNAPASYTAWTGTRTVTAGGSTLGITTSFFRNEDLLFADNYVSGMRVTAFFVAGRRVIAVNNRIKNCHREKDSSGVGGGVLATATNWSGNTTIGVGVELNASSILVPKYPGAIEANGGMIFANNTIVGVTNSTTGEPDYTLGGGFGGVRYDHGIEVEHTDGLIIADNHIDGPGGIGIKISSTSSHGTQNVILTGNHVSNVKATTGVPTSPTNGSTALTIGTGTGGFVRNITVDGLAIENCENGIYVYNGGTSCTKYSFNSVSTHDVVRPLTDTTAQDDWSSGTDHKAYASSGSYSSKPLPFRQYRSYGTGTVSDPSEYGIVAANASTTGNGAWFWGGNSAATYALRVGNRTATDVFYVTGNGQMVLGGDAAAAYVTTLGNTNATGLGLSVSSKSKQLNLSTTDTGASIRLMQSIQENGSDRFFLGMTSADLLGVFDAAGTGALMTIGATGQATHRGTSAVAFPLLVNSETAATIAGVQVQRSAVSKATFGIDASDNPFIGDGTPTALLTINSSTGALSGPTFTWTTFTPTVEQTAANVLTNLTVTRAKYCVVGKICYVNFQLTFSGATGATAGEISVKPGSGPTAPALAGTHAVIGQGFIYDASGTVWYEGSWVAASSTTWNLVLSGSNGTYAGTAGDANWTTPLPAFQLATSDVISGMLVYETA